VILCDETSEDLDYRICHELSAFFAGIDTQDSLPAVDVLRGRKPCLEPLESLRCSTSNDFGSHLYQLMLAADDELEDQFP
jgi:hypothetical protein